MAAYTITLFEYASAMQSGTIEQRKSALRQWLFEDAGLIPELREKFESVFMSRYLFTEIGFEEPYLFRDRLNARISEISGYYNQVYKLNKALVEWNFMEDEIDYLEYDRLDHAGNEAYQNGSQTDNSENRAQNQTYTENNRQTGKTSEEYGEKEDYEEKSEAEGNNTTDRKYGENGSSVTNGLNTGWKVDSSEVTRDGNNSSTGYENGTNAVSGNTVNSGTDTAETDMFHITQQNGSVSQFPQGNVSMQMDYYSQGNEGNQKVQDTGDVKTIHGLRSDTTNTTTVDMKNGSQETIDESEVNKENGSYHDNIWNEDHKENSGTEDIDGSHTETSAKNSNGEKSGNRQNIRDLLDLIDRVEKLDNTLEARQNQNERGDRYDNYLNQNDIRRMGRMSRRPIPEIIEGIENTFKNIPSIMCQECSDLFMTIY